MKRKDTSSYDALSNFNWETIVKEFQDKFPEVFKLVIGMLTTEGSKNVNNYLLLPTAGLIYGVLAQVNLLYCIIIVKKYNVALC